MSVSFRDVRMITDAMTIGSDWSPGAFEPYRAERAERMRRLRFASAGSVPDQRLRPRGHRQASPAPRDVRRQSVRLAGGDGARRCVAPARGDATPTRRGRRSSPRSATARRRADPSADRDIVVGMNRSTSLIRTKINADLELRGRSGEGPVRAAPRRVRLRRRRLRGRVHDAPQRRGLRGARVAPEAGDLPRADRHGHGGARRQAGHAGDDRAVRRDAPRAPRGRHRSGQGVGELRHLPHRQRGVRVPARGDRRVAPRAEVVPALPAGVAPVDGVARPSRPGGRVSARWSSPSTASWPATARRTTGTASRTTCAST